MMSLCRREPGTLGAIALGNPPKVESGDDLWLQFMPLARTLPDMRRRQVGVSSRASLIESMSGAPSLCPVQRGRTRTDHGGYGRRRGLRKDQARL